METRLLIALLEKKRILFLLDGADEMPAEQSYDLRNVYKELLGYSYYLMTTRPYRLPPLSSFDYSWKILGFNLSEACQYVEKFFDALGSEKEEKIETLPADVKEEKKSIVTDKKSDVIIEQIKKNPVWRTLSRSPLLLELACTLQHQVPEIKFLASMRTTDLYQGILQQLFWQYLHETLKKPIKGTTRKTSMQHPWSKTVIQVLQQLALVAKEADQINITTLLLEQVLKGCDYERAQAQDILECSILKPTTSDDQGINACYFAHTSFLDFFLAQLIAEQINRTAPPQIDLEWIQQHRYGPAYYPVWAFVAGILRINNSSEKLDLFFNLLLAEPRYGSFYEIPLLMNCLEQCIAILVDPIIAPQNLMEHLIVKIKTILLDLMTDGNHEIPATWLNILSLSPVVLQRMDLITSLRFQLKDQQQQVRAAIIY
ncbi:MAG: hypothetical protein JSR33_13945 [Proteobacteria bacterium]|nr:hypothetical protein [Pseudomonadota bacterium]